jgi:hypothetical protein
MLCTPKTRTHPPSPQERSRAQHGRWGERACARARPPLEENPVFENGAPPCADQTGGTSTPPASARRRLVRAPWRARAARRPPPAMPPHALFDAHCHLQDPRVADAAAALAAARDAGVATVACCGCWPGDWEAVLALAAAHAGALLPQLGVHPWWLDRAPDVAAWLPALRARLDAHPRAGVGECGLDFQPKSRRAARAPARGLRGAAAARAGARAAGLGALRPRGRRRPRGARAAGHQRAGGAPRVAGLGRGDARARGRAAKRLLLARRAPRGAAAGQGDCRRARGARRPAAPRERRARRRAAGVLRSTIRAAASAATAAMAQGAMRWRGSHVAAPSAARAACNHAPCHATTTAYASAPANMRSASTLAAAMSASPRIVPVRNALPTIEGVAALTRHVNSTYGAVQAANAVGEGSALPGSMLWASRPKRERRKTTQAVIASATTAEEITETVGNMRIVRAAAAVSVATAAVSAVYPSPRSSSSTVRRCSDSTFALADIVRIRSRSASSSSSSRRASANCAFNEARSFAALSGLAVGSFSFSINFVNSSIVIDHRDEGLVSERQRRRGSGGVVGGRAGHDGAQPRGALRRGPAAQQGAWRGEGEARGAAREASRAQHLWGILSGQSAQTRDDEGRADTSGVKYICGGSERARLMP